MYLWLVFTCRSKYLLYNIVLNLWYVDTVITSLKNENYDTGQFLVFINVKLALLGSQRDWNVRNFLWKFELKTSIYETIETNKIVKLLRFSGYKPT